MPVEVILIKGAKAHNLKNISLTLPRNKLIVITGLSGSGKSSLAFDTIYAEGQRRYVESLSSYARQFLERLDKPDVEYIEGLSPAIAIEQRTAGGNPRSTVGTQTEIYDYLRLLFARIGTPHCYKCGKVIQRQSPDEIVARIMGLPQHTKIEILAPLIKGRKGEYRDILKMIQKEGFVRARIDGKVYELGSKINLDKYKIHNIEAVVDRITVDVANKKRITDSVETALKAGKGMVIVHRPQTTDHRPQQKNKSSIDHGLSTMDLVFSELYACPDCGINIAEIEPRIFSFNSPYGACPACNGLGTKMEFDVDLIIPDRDRSILEGALEPWRRGGKGYLMYYRMLIRELAGRLGFSLDTPFKKLSKEVQRSIIYGSDEVIWNKPFEGLIPHLGRLFNQTESDYLKEHIAKFMSVLPCPECQASRLKKESLAVKIKGKSIYDVTLMPLKVARDFFLKVDLSQSERFIAKDVLKEINARINFCINVGLEYLTLERKSSTLSGGESQRIRLATQVGSGLTGVLYVLDEPSIGLHQRDNHKLLVTLKRLRDLGNTLIIVEHDEATIRESDYVVDLGPHAGRFGGEVVFSGEVNALLKHRDSLTAKYLRKELSVYLPRERRSLENKKYLELFGCRQHNLKDINVRIPLAVFTCISGVSGSGKSTLIDEILYKALQREIYKSKVKPGKFDKIKGADFIDKVIEIDQSSIGRTPRSNPATYTGVFSFIREIFSRLPEAKVRGYKPGRFSFNVKGGRCEACNGDGIKKIEMHFLPDVYVTCEVCKGRRFSEQTQGIKYKGQSISDVLEMPVEEAYNLFENIPRIKDVLGTLIDVGLGYIQLGQSATTLSGGEAQRIKLASELSKRSTGKTFYILDEPTTGLHFADVDKLLKVLDRLVERGNTVVVVEHNLDVLKSADYIIDLGPEGGDAGGEVVASGAPEEIAENKKSYTGEFLKKMLMSLVVLLFICRMSSAICHSSFAQSSAKEEEDLSVAAFAQYSLGWSFYDEEKWSEAKDAFMEFRQKFPRHSLREDTDFKIALCFYNLKDYLRAKENFDAYIKDYPLSRALNEALFYRAECLYYLGELNQAEKDYLKVTTDTGDANLLELAQAGLGWAYIKLKKYPEAEDIFNKITLVNNRAYVSVLLGKAEVAKQKQNYKSALELYNKFIEDFPNDESISAAYLGKAESLSHLLRYEEAVSVYNNILAYYVNETFPAGFTDKVHYNLAQAYLKMGNFTQAILEFDKAAEQSIEPAIKINAICQIGDIYQDLGEFNKAIDNYEKILKDFSDNVYKDYAQYQLSLCLIKTAKFDEAISTLKKIETDFPESKIKDEVGYYIGLSYFQKQDFVSAIEELNKFISLFAQSPLRREGIYLKGASLFNLKSYHEAEDVFREAIKESGQDLNFVAKCEFEIAHCLYQNKEKDDAIKKCQEIISRYPNSAIASDVIYFLGEHYLNTAKEEVAVRYFRRLISDYRESNLLPNTYYSLGLVYLGQDKYDEALTQFNNLLDSSNDEFKARAVLAIGDVYFKKGDLESALRHYRQALNKASQDKAAEIQFKIAQALEEGGRVDEAVEEYFKNSYFYPQDKYWLLKSYLRLARIFEDRENWPEAERIYSKVADMEVEEAKFARERLDLIKGGK